MKNIGVIIIATIFVLVVVETVAEYTHESDMTARVVSLNTQRHTVGDKDSFRTSYKYIVATDKGPLEIAPDGLMASRQFGALQEGKTYCFHLRGYSIVLLGIYPFIIEAKEPEACDESKNEK
jgi:hypothetical protein